MTRQEQTSGIWSYRNKLRRRNSRLIQAAAAVEPLERRVLLSSISIIVQNGGDNDGGTASITTVNSTTFDAPELRDAVNFANARNDNATTTFTSALINSTTTITLTNTNGPLLLSNAYSQSITIDGDGGISVSGDGSITVLQVYR